MVGLGAIGGGVAVSLARGGLVPQVYDIRPDAAGALAGVPGPLASPAEVARSSDVVMVAVLDADQARQVITGADGLLSAAHPGLTVVLLSTVALPVVRELAAACAASGAGFLDCGVTPGDRAAEHGMVAIVGGDERVVEAARPVLDGWARKIVHCGPTGAGMATKIARNVITYGGWRTVAEAAALVRAAGVDPGTLAGVIDAADPEGATLLQLLRMRRDGLPAELAGRIEVLMRKDLDAARELAGDLGVGVPLVDVTRDRVRHTLGLPDAAADPAAPPAAPGSAPPTAPGSAEPSSALPADRRERGLAMMDRVYPGLGGLGEPADPFTTQTVDYLFADVWSRPDLSVRDRRLLTLGVAAATGRADLIRIQAAGALDSGELTAPQLREAVLHLALYVGWCDATATHQGVTAALADHAAATPDAAGTGTGTGTGTADAATTADAAPSTATPATDPNTDTAPTTPTEQR
ncbi:NAD(P)-binding domain-containing protein [Streptomyces sp. SL13]|uniref:NAD(P)-binding domain-containing protein n=1 Tax=Streptantibioticus silvisoli TaxID=2705255 RepID=A0AA90KH15_9ACTN|nr:NAD(P)-binding domain-containing protein [Streptantibioticus silvisoli]MDI5971205.1 NAD(P)-binding domain-containing protein [Streptantibioticus silvisoli]